MTWSNLTKSKEYVNKNKYSIKVLPNERQRKVYVMLKKQQQIIWQNKITYDSWKRRVGR